MRLNMVRAYLLKPIMKKPFDRFDMAKPPISTRWYLRPITWFLSFPDVWKHRAEGLHRVLYQCPHCGTEFQMASEGSRLFCKHCDCIDLNTLQDTWYTYPQGDNFSVTKMALATEELYFAYRRSVGRPCKPGLA